MESLLFDLAQLFALCVAAGVVFQRLRMPPIVGYLAIGALIGPHSIGLVRHEPTVHQLAEVGVIVLLFAVGMEVPLSQLARLRRTILLGGGLQIVGTVVAAAGTCWLADMPWNQSLFLGFLLSLSSTAAVTKVLTDHGEFASPHGRLAIGVSIAQDLAVVPMILLMPMLIGGVVVPAAGHGGAGSGGGVLRSLENLAILIAVLAAARLLVPRVLRVVARTRSRELFVLTLAALCLSMAVVTSKLGMSMALGSFLAGILLADSEFHGQASAEVEPFRDALASLFFVSIGMLFDAGTIAASPWLVLAALLAVFAGKTAIVVLAARVLGQPAWVRLRAGLLLAQVGEFSFVLVQIGGDTDVLSLGTQKIFMVVAVLSIAATPLLHGLGHWLFARGRARTRATEAPAQRVDERLHDHAIVVGYGPTGRTIVQAMMALQIEVVALEMNASTAKQERDRGVPVEHGDASRLSVLKRLGIERARILVLAINDVEASRRIAQIARTAAPHLHVIARAVYIGEVDMLKGAGANEVVPQELEASVEILVRVLRRFLVADDEIGKRVTAVRQAAGHLDKQAAVARLEAARIAEFVPGIGIGVHRVAAGAVVAGRTLTEAGVRRSTGCTIVAIRRGRENLTAITAETRLQAGDAVVVIGPESRLADAIAVFHAPVDGTASGAAAAVLPGAPEARS